MLLASRLADGARKMKVRKNKVWKNKVSVLLAAEVAIRALADRRAPPVDRGGEDGQNSVCLRPSWDGAVRSGQR